MSSNIHVGGSCTELVYYQVTLSLEYAPTNWF